MIPPVITELVMSVAPVTKHTPSCSYGPISSARSQLQGGSAATYRHCAGGAPLNGNGVRLVRLLGSGCIAAFTCSYPFSFIWSGFSGMYKHPLCFYCSDFQLNVLWLILHTFPPKCDLTARLLVSLCDSCPAFYYIKPEDSGGAETGRMRTKSRQHPGANSSLSLILTHNRCRNVSLCNVFDKSE